MRAKLFRRIVTVVLLLSMLSVFCSCHGVRKSIAFTTPDVFDENREYNISFWAKNDTNKTQTEIYQKAVDDFQKLYPNVHITLKFYTDYGKIYNDVITNIATGTTPNVCISYPDHIATYLTGDNVVVPLDDLMKDAKYGLGGSELRFDGPEEKEIVPEFLSECVVSGYHYALPYMRSTEACYINETLLQKLGYEVPDVLTWDFVFEVSEKAMEKNADGTFKVNGQKTMIPFIYKSTDNMLISMLKQKNAGYSSEAGDVLLFNDTTEEILLNIAEHAGTGAFSTFKISSYPANFLNAGQCIFAVDSTAGATWMGTNAPLSDISKDSIREFQTVVREIPQYDPENPEMISQGPSVCIFNKEDSGEVLASWLFMQYLLTNEVQIAYSETEGYVPVTLKAQEDPEYRDYLNREGEDNRLHYDVKIQAAKLLLQNTDRTFVTPVFNGSASLRDAAGQMVETVTKSKRRKQTVDHAFIENLYSEMTSLYRLDRISGNGGKVNLGPLPGTAKLLLLGILAAWVFILLYAGITALRSRKKDRKS